LALDQYSTVKYEELVEELLTRPGRSFVLAPGLEACVTYEDFLAGLDRLSWRNTT
jgi:hypothetical protein